MLKTGELSIQKTGGTTILHIYVLFKSTCKGNHNTAPGKALPDFPQCQHRPNSRPTNSEEDKSEASQIKTELIQRAALASPDYKLSKEFTIHKVSAAFLKDAGPKTILWLTRFYSNIVKISPRCVSEAK